MVLELGKKAASKTQWTNPYQNSFIFWINDIFTLLLNQIHKIIAQVRLNF